jgi:hypothetical protein
VVTGGATSVTGLRTPLLVIQLILQMIRTCISKSICCMCTCDVTESCNYVMRGNVTIRAESVLFRIVNTKVKLSL